MQGNLIGWPESIERYLDLIGISVARQRYAWPMSSTWSSPIGTNGGLRVSQTLTQVARGASHAVNVCITAIGLT